VVSTLLLLTLNDSVHPTPTTGSPNVYLPKHWLVEPPLQLPPSTSHPHYNALQSLLLSRISLVQLSTLCSVVLFLHMSASRLMRWTVSESSSRRLPSPPPSSHNLSTYYSEEERDKARTLGWIPKSEMRRTWLYSIFCVSLTVALLVLKSAFVATGVHIWKGEFDTTVHKQRLTFT